MSPSPGPAGAERIVPSYHSRFGNWDERASVRTKPRRVVTGATEDLVFFPPEQVPALTHPLVVARGAGARHRLLVRALFQYLHFTTVLEQVAVLPVTARISMRGSGLVLPDAMVEDAFKITTDEAWHAQFSHEFIGDVSAATGVAADGLAEPAFTGRLSRLRESFPGQYRALADLMFTVVSETLVSRMLSDIPHDQRLPRPVRALVADHAADEGKHHSYFRDLLRILWPSLTPAEQHLVGTRVPEFVAAFLAPDLTGVRQDLLAIGLDPAQAATVLDETYERSPRSGSWMRDAARSTVRAFEEVGALAEPSIHEAFHASGLVLRAEPPGATCES